MPTLNWIGKEAVVNHHQTVPFRRLAFDAALGVGGGGFDPQRDNLLVEGDNLHALKTLLPLYAGQVKCIYIDPPYNTGNEGWVYNDNVNAPEIKKWLHETVKGEGEDLSRHDKWLCMMYPRLRLLRDFLREDGAIFISIDDNEVANLRLLLDEIFGARNFVANIVWQKRYSRENREAIGDVHDFIVIYAKNPNLWKKTRNRIPIDTKQAKVYKNPNNDPRGRWRGIPITAQEGHATPEQFYEIVTPSGRVLTPTKGRCWGIAKATFERYRSEGRIYFGKNGDSQPNVIRYLSEVEGMVPWTWWPHEEVGHTDEAKKEIYSLLGTGAPFDTPKPTRLIERILQIATNPGDLVLDSFAGSGTTGHAVLKMNQAKPDETARRFILIEMEPNIAQGITAQRLQRAIAGYGEENKRVEGLGGGFAYARLGEPLLKDGTLRGDVSREELARHLFYGAARKPLPSLNGSPLLGVADGVAYYLLWNKGAPGLLSAATLKSLPEHSGPKIVFAASSRVAKKRLAAANIVLRQVPYEI